MTAEGPQLSADAGVVRVVRELVDAAIAARPYVLAEAALDNSGLGTIVGRPAVHHLERLDAALADAGELLDGVAS